jgi:cell wall-associated NlpC family hydrolase
VSALVAEARTYLGCRFRHQGRSRQGIDCAGLVIEAAKAVHGSTFDKTDYDRQASDETMIKLCEQHLNRVDLANLQPGDVLVMRFENQRHMAIVTDYPGALGMIHAAAINRKVVEHRLDSAWRARIMRAYRFPEV